MNEIETKESLASQHFWFGVFTVVFIAMIMFIMRLYGSIAMGTLVNITPFHFVILSIATFRITRLIVSDRITQGLRDFCMIISASTDPETGSTYIVRTKRVRGVRRAIGEIMGCPWCMGMWIAVVALALYVAATVYSFVSAWAIIFIFALAGSASVIQSAVSIFSSSKTEYKGPERRSPPNVCTECGGGAIL